MTRMGKAGQAVRCEGAEQGVSEVVEIVRSRGARQRGCCMAFTQSEQHMLQQYCAPVINEQRWDYTPWVWVGVLGHSLPPRIATEHLRSRCAKIRINLQTSGRHSPCACYEWHDLVAWEHVHWLQLEYCSLPATWQTPAEQGWQ